MGSETNHFSQEDWADFVRGTATPERVGEMQQHLDSGCALCRGAEATWSTVLEISRFESANEPPASAVRLAKALYAIERPRSVFAWVPETARLLFDSQAEALPVGVRNGAPAARKLLFDAGEFLIDVQLEASGPARRVGVIGQVVSQQDPPETVGGGRVLLFRSGTMIASTTTNEFGEFHVEFDDAENVSCVVGLGAKAMVVPFAGLTSGSNTQGV